MPLSFRNVTGQSTNSGSSALKNAGSLFNRALDNFIGVGKENKEEERSDLLFQQGQEDRLNKLASDKIKTEQAGKVFNRKINADNLRIQDAEVARSLETDDVLFNAGIELDSAKQKEQAILSSLLEDAPLNPTQELEADKKLNTTLNQESPDAVFGSSLPELPKVVEPLINFFSAIPGFSPLIAPLTSGGRLGGKELQTEINKIKETGININGNIKFPNSTQFEKAFRNTAENLGEGGLFSRDTNVKRSDYLKELTRLLKQKDKRSTTRSNASKAATQRRRNLEAVRRKIIRDTNKKIRGR